MFTSGIFCSFIDPALHGVILPLIFTASFVAFFWGVFYYAIQGEYDEFAREMSKALMLWSVLAFLCMALVWWLLDLAYDAAGVSSVMCG